MLLYGTEAAPYHGHMTKFMLTLLLGLLSPLVHAAGPSFGQHGMALFGGSEGLYASHLPMFHAPHDAQLILQLRLADPAADRALRGRLQSGTTLWTLAPEKFELDQFSAGNKAPYPSFQADLVLGHFEQGGATQYANVKVIVEKVIYYRKLSAAPAVNAQAGYLQVGSGRQRFLVKEIDSRPDFDHIVAIKAGRATPRSTVTVSKVGMHEPAPAALVRTLPGARVAGTVYFDSDDLK